MFPTQAEWEAHRAFLLATLDPADGQVTDATYNEATGVVTLHQGWRAKAEGVILSFPIPPEPDPS